MEDILNKWLASKGKDGKFILRHYFDCKLPPIIKEIHSELWYVKPSGDGIYKHRIYTSSGTVSCPIGLVDSQYKALDDELWIWFIDNINQLLYGI